MAKAPAALFGVALSVCGIATADTNRDSTDFSIYERPQRLVEVEPGRKLNLVCLGNRKKPGHPASEDMQHAEYK